MIVLRDGRHLVGVLRSFDQFSNMVMEDTSERRVLNVKVGGGGNGSNGGKGGKGVASTICYYTDIQLGLYLVRGDSMVLLGEVEIDHDTDDTDNTDTDNKDGKTSEEAKEKEQPGNDNANVDTSMTGSGLLGGPEKDVAEEKKKYMKKVTLEEFETLVEENQKQNGDGNSNGDGDDQGAVEQLTWEFDADLYV
jgi:small nuclear ribonucleoprotein (snRNP)-like protein